MTRFLTAIAFLGLIAGPASLSAHEEPPPTPDQQMRVDLKKWLACIEKAKREGWDPKRCW